MTDLEHDAEQEQEQDDDATRSVVARLARRTRDGGAEIERAAILAEGDGAAAILAWIEAHGGRGEALPPPKPGRGLHADRTTSATTPRRYVLPPGALT